MRVRYIGQYERTNSFGTFKPGKLYDVSEEVGKKLLTAPSLFIPEGGIQPDSAKLRIVEVDETDGAGGANYDAMDHNALRALCGKRGVMLQRNVRKAEMVKLLKEADNKTDDITSSDIQIDVPKQE